MMERRALNHETHRRQTRQKGEGSVKRSVRASLLGVVLVLVMVLVPTSIAAATTAVYADDQAGWEAAAGSWETEDFNDATLNADVSVESDKGSINVGGYWFDRPEYGTDDQTTWTFSEPICAWGGTWYVGSDWTGGPGSHLEVFLGDTWETVGVIPNYYDDQFWGIVSDAPFTQVRLTAYNDDGWRESYALDDMVYGGIPLDIKQHALTQIESLLAGDLQSAQRSMLDKAAGQVTKSLDPAFWVDGFHLERSSGTQVFGYEAAAAESLLRSHCTGAQSVISKLVTADRLLALAAIGDAVAGHGNSTKIAAARKSLQQGDRYRYDSRRAVQAINAYRDAWKYAIAAGGKLK